MTDLSIEESGEQNEKQTTVAPIENSAFEANEPPPPTYDQAKTMPIKNNAVSPAPIPQPVTTQPMPTVGPDVAITTNPVVVVAQPATTINPYILGSHSVMVTCPYCHQTVSILKIRKYKKFILKYLGANIG